MLSVSHIAGDRLSHQMFASLDFIQVIGYLRLGKSDWNFALNSMLRLVFSQTILSYRTLSIHASAVYVKGLVCLLWGEAVLERVLMLGCGLIRLMVHSCSTATILLSE